MDVVERFIRYTKIGTNSCDESESVPSTAVQLELGRLLVDEMKEIGIDGVHMDGKGYVYGYLPASPGCENEPAIGLIAHMDTSPAVKGDGIKAKAVKYTCGDLLLNEEKNIYLKLSSFPYLAEQKGKELIVTDGTTLLGADDKAGIAEILSAAEYINTHKEIRHGKIAIGFTPDEEIGRGADFFDVKGFGCDFAYTVDGGELGEIEYENFNAASAKFKINGINIHPGSAKNKMKNASLIAAEIIGMFPAYETPASTEGYEGFYHVCGISGDESNAEISMIIRDHDMVKFIKRKEFTERLASYINGKYGEGTVELILKDSYYNMKEKIEPCIEIIDRAKAAMEKCGVKPKIVAIRGGTDGARLSYEGLPCPNLSTGGYNFHSVYEFIPVESMKTMREVLINIVSC